jgi:hypothetical protein
LVGSENPDADGFLSWSAAPTAPTMASMCRSSSEQRTVATRA